MAAEAISSNVGLRRRLHYNNVRPHSSLGNQTPAEARRALEQFEGSAHDALAQNETDEYEIQTRKLSL
ncbi:integrase core domain-containing protein [Pseudophaeobacter sp. C1-32P7]|uniref:integrase core domain-containing protein n=1 Tax=Pseudophaeobacter sp. C1-32P7 TaxID=3098142 RepID=UPI0034D7A7C6